MSEISRRIFLAGLSGAAIDLALNRNTTVFARSFNEDTVSKDTPVRTVDCPVHFIDSDFDPQDFEKSIYEARRNNLFPIQLADLSRYFDTGEQTWPINTKPTIFVIRGGTINQFNQALPILNKWQIQATFAATPDADAVNRMTNKQVNEISRVREVACLYEGEDKTDIVVVKKRLEQITGKPVFSVVSSDQPLDPEIVAKLQYKIAAVDGDNNTQASSNRFRVTGQGDIQKFIEPPLFFAGDRTKPYVFFTLDDCWQPALVRKAIAIADKYRARLTFFPAGSVVARDPQLWINIFKEGKHAIENHTWSHGYLSQMNQEQVKDEIVRPYNFFKSLFGETYNQHFFRPPFAGVNQTIRAVCAERGLKIVTWSADTLGWKIAPLSTDAGTVKQLVTNVNTEVRNGGIIVMHGNPNDIVALDDLIQLALSRNLKLCNLKQALR